MALDMFDPVKNSPVTAFVITSMNCAPGRGGTFQLELWRECAAKQSDRGVPAEVTGGE